MLVYLGFYFSKAVAGSRLILINLPEVPLLWRRRPVKCQLTGAWLRIRGKKEAKRRRHWSENSYEIQVQDLEYVVLP